MKRNYLVKQFSPMGAAKEFQKACDELSAKGWFLQEFHTIGPTAGIYAVFYKDDN